MAGRGGNNRLSKLEKEERENQILAMMMQGMSLREIGQNINVSERQIRKIVNTIRGKVRERVATADHYQVLGEHISELWEMERQCLRDASETEGLARKSFIDTALQYRKARISLQLETGLMNKAAEKVDLFMTEDGVDLRKVGREELMNYLVNEEESLLKLIKESKKED